MNFSQRLKSFFSKSPSLSAETEEDLCDLLIEGDFGARQAYKIIESLKERYKNETSPDALKILCSLLEEELLRGKNATVADAKDNLTVVLLLGVNGVGKTTTAAKLANLYGRQTGKKTILAAGDTFRAAAIDQLKIHGEKLRMRVIAHKQGGDPAAVVYDALEAALSTGASFVVADTAGRMHTKTSLIEELKKTDRVVESKAKDAKYIKYLVLDATTGRNAFSQAEVFNEAVAFDGVILTKYDSTAKGGVVFSIVSELGLPVAYICNGEKYTDIELFDAKKFVKEFSGS